MAPIHACDDLKWRSEEAHPALWTPSVVDKRRRRGRSNTDRTSGQWPETKKTKTSIDRTSEDNCPNACWATQRLRELSVVQETWRARRAHARLYPELDLFPSTILPSGTTAKIRHGTLPPKRPTRSS